MEQLLSRSIWSRAHVAEHVKHLLPGADGARVMETAYSPDPTEQLLSRSRWKSIHLLLKANHHTTKQVRQHNRSEWPQHNSGSWSEIESWWTPTCRCRLMSPGQ